MGKENVEAWKSWIDAGSPGDYKKFEREYIQQQRGVLVRKMPEARKRMPELGDKIGIELRPSKQPDADALREAEKLKRTIPHRHQPIRRKVDRAPITKQKTNVSKDIAVAKRPLPVRSISKKRPIGEGRRISRMLKPERTKRPVGGEKRIPTLPTMKPKYRPVKTPRQLPKKTPVQKVDAVRMSIDKKVSHLKAIGRPKTAATIAKVKSHIKTSKPTPKQKVGPGKRPTPKWKR